MHRECGDPGRDGRIGNGRHDFSCKLQRHRGPASTRGVHVPRQFHDETIVNRFVLNKSLTKGNRIVFDTEAIENFTAGWRARESYTVVSPDEFVEEFYLAPPDGEYEMFVTNHFRRALGEGHSP